MYIINKVMDDFEFGLVEYEHGNLGMEKRSVKTIECIAWIVTFSESHGQSSPEDLCNVLPPFISKRCMFSMYSEEINGDKISYSSFCDLLNTQFGHRRRNKTVPMLRDAINEIVISKFQGWSKFLMLYFPF
jgi:hypothetical protein